MFARRDPIPSYPHGPKVSVAGQKRLGRSSMPRLNETDNTCEIYEWKALGRECIIVVRLVGDGCQKP